jgi:AcrR family transcriptional regulator
VRGFRGTTIADIADEAQIALGTIYNYFPSKEDVFAALNQRLAEIITGAGLLEAPARTLDDNVRVRISRIFAACDANRDLVRLVVLNTDPDTRVSRAIRDADEDRARPLVASLETALKAGLLRAGDAGIMAKLIHGLVSIAVYQAFVVSDGSDASKYRDACADMIVAYLAPPPR